MRIFLTALFGLVMAGWCAAPAAAQTSRVVTTCGSPPIPYVSGQFNYNTVDIFGNQCGAGGGGSSNPTFVNIAQILGAPPSLTNPLWIANAEAADSSGTFTNATQTTSITNLNADGYAGGLISINGTYATASGVFEASDDGGTTWYSVICTRSDGSASETGYTALTNTNRQWSCPVGGNDGLRLRSTAVASGTVNGRVGISAPPAPSNPILSTGAPPYAATTVVGSMQKGVSTATAVSLIVPATAKFCNVIPVVANVNWESDGSAPTAGANGGLPVNLGSGVQVSAAVASTSQFINQVGASGALLNYECYR